MENGDRWSVILSWSFLTQLTDMLVIYNYMLLNMDEDRFEFSPEEITVYVSVFVNNTLYTQINNLIVN